MGPTSGDTEAGAASRGPVRNPLSPASLASAQGNRSGPRRRVRIARYAGRTSILLAIAVVLLVDCSGQPTSTPEVATQAPTKTAVLPSRPPTATVFPTASASQTATLTPTSEPTTTPTPAPAPVVDLIAFESNRDWNSDIYLLDVLSGLATNLTRHPSADRAPAWRPDGSAIAFESHRDDNWDIYVLDLTDGTLSRVTSDPAFDGSPSWSPDGRELAFESYRDGNLELYAVAATGGQPRRVTDHPAGDYGPAWHPDGSSIAFTSWRDGDKEIYLIPAEGGEAQNLTRHESDDESPAWSPDGSQLAFTSWRDVDSTTGNRNAEIYALSLDHDVVESGDLPAAQRVTDNPWPDLDPAWDDEARLVWTAYEPGQPFETHDPFRPGYFQLYRLGVEGPHRLTTSAADERQPAPGPPSRISIEALAEHLPPEPPAPTRAPVLEPGTLAEVDEVPSILASYSDQPVRVNEMVAPSLVALQHDILEASGRDLLAETLGAWRSIDQVRKREMYQYDYGYLSWHKAGRALDLPLEYKVDGVNQMLVSREDLGTNVYWRMYLRTAAQDGTQGEPLKEYPWQYWWHIVAEHDPEAYDAGGKRLPVPPGYYIDITSIAKRHGWNRIACYAIEDDYHWLTDSNGTEYWHYERTDGLIWWDAMRQLYSPETLHEHVGWEAGLQHAQTEAMMRSKGVPESTPSP
jgi:TolB protein